MLIYYSGKKNDRDTSGDINNNANSKNANTIFGFNILNIIDVAIDTDIAALDMSTMSVETNNNSKNIYIQVDINKADISNMSAISEEINNNLKNKNAQIGTNKVNADNTSIINRKTNNNIKNTDAQTSANE